MATSKHVFLKLKVIVVEGVNNNTHTSISLLRFVKFTGLKLKNVLRMKKLHLEKLLALKESKTWNALPSGIEILSSFSDYGSNNLTNICGWRFSNNIT
jgi:hypothetical protein